MFYNHQLGAHRPLQQKIVKAWLGCACLAVGRARLGVAALGAFNTRHAADKVARVRSFLLLATAQVMVAGQSAVLGQLLPTSPVVHINSYIPLLLGLGREQDCCSTCALRLLLSE